MSCCNELFVVINLGIRPTVLEGMTSSLLGPSMLEKVYKVIVEARTDLLDHPYFMVMDVWELNRAREKTRRTRIINCYDNWLGMGHCWHGESERQRRALEDVQWDQVIEGRLLRARPGDAND